MLAIATGSTASWAALASSASSLKVPAGPRYPTRPRPPSRSGRVFMHRRRFAGPGERQSHGLGLLGGELQFAVPAVHLLSIDARLIAMVDAREHDARLFVVQQGNRHRLVAG